MKTKHATQIRMGIILGRGFKRFQELGERKKAMACFNDALKYGNRTYEAFDRARLK